MSKIPQIVFFSNNIELTPFEKDYSYNAYLPKTRVKKLRHRG